ncbi:MAG: CBS domain-containing protein [bacterium]|jgi:CBS domain-containing protein
MKKNLTVASSSESVADVVKKMSKHNQGAILVVDNDKLCGIFSERDLLNKVVAVGKDPVATKVSEVATTDIVSVDQNMHVKKCAEIIREKGFRHIPVVDEAGKAIGIISSRDFFQYLTSGLESFIDKEIYKQELEDGLDPYDHVGAGYEEK